MPYPDDRYPKVPSFPRPRTLLITSDQVLVDRDWYENICQYIEDLVTFSLTGLLPIGTENQTVRKNATVWEATSVLKINADGPENTVDHSTGTSLRMVNVVYVASPGSLVAANTVPVGTLGIIYTP